MPRPPWPFLRQTRTLIRALALGFALQLASAAGASALDLATGLQAAVGIDFDEVNNHLYFVEYNANPVVGTVKRLLLTPPCDNPAAVPESCTVEVVATGLTHPEDIAVDGATGVAYVTTRDFPLGTTGALYEIDLKGGVPAPANLVAFNLRAPHQIVLDPPTHSAWVVGFGTGAGSGRVWHIDLATGAKVAVITGLNSPVGLAVSSDRAKAYVSEQGPPTRVGEFDLATGARMRDLVSSLTAPFFLRWSDSSETALYAVERDPANQVPRVDLVAGAAVVAIPSTSLHFRPSGIAVNHLGGAAYVTTDDSVVRVELVSLPPAGPIFLSVGWIAATATAIDANGYSLDPSFFHAPFGGTLDIFGSLTKFYGLGARSYRVLVSKDGGPFTPVAQSWNVQKYDLSSGTFKQFPVAPDSTGRYTIPPEYDPNNYAGYLFLPQLLMLKWPSSANGLYTFKVEIFTAAGTDNTWLLVPGENSLALQVDNSGPEVDLEEIEQLGSGVVDPCEIVASGANSYQFRITARDPNHHLLNYRLSALWGKNSSDPNVAADTYSPVHVDAEGPYAWSGVAHTLVPISGWAASCNCAHTFVLDAWKRTTNGYSHIQHGSSHQSITINNAGAVCP